MFFNDLLLLLPYSIGVVTAIIIPTIIIALQEQQIEGLFGWSSLTFTKRWATNTFFSKIYRGIAGKDKWATGYHLMSNTIWILIFVISLLYIPLFSKFAGIRNGNAFLSTIAIATFSCIQLMWVEDYVWFLLHPYYGPERHTPEYVPWFQNFKGGIPSTYWVSMVAGLVTTAITATVTGDIKILLIWGESMFLLLITVFFIIKPIGSNIKRLSLKKFWWEDNKFIIIQRCPYPLEAGEPFTERSAFVIDNNTMDELLSSGKAKLLKDNLRKSE